MTGFVKIHRKILDHPMFIGRPDWLGAWVILISEANYKDSHLARGELRMSQERMCRLLGWTRKKVRYFLDELCSNGMISRDAEGSKKGQIGAKISICNYSKYQDLAEGEGQIGARSGPHTERRKKEEELNICAPEGAPVSDRFDEFWQAYPRKTNKKEARKAWDRAVKRAKPETIMAGVKQRVGGLSNRPDYIPHASTWLNNDRWENAPDLPNGHSHAELDFLLKPRPDTRHLEIVGDYN